jgi:lipopolysaccharide biosynthesis glycosyltransferase
MIDNQFPNIDKRIPRAAYYRLFLSALLPEKVDKVLYFDGDIIVRHSLTELWNTDVSGHALAAVPDMREGVIDRYNRLKYSPSWGYFNSGMLLINLKYWREHHALERFLDCIQKHHAQLVYHDQDVLNYVFHEQKIMLPIKFNFQHGHLWKEPLYDYWKYEQQVLEARKDPVIIHYTGGKPWTKYIKYHNPYSSSFYKYQNLSKWRGIKVDNRSIYTKIRTAVGDVLRWMKIRPTDKNNFIEINPID